MCTPEDDSSLQASGTGPDRPAPGADSDEDLVELLGSAPQAGRRRGVAGVGPGGRGVPREGQIVFCIESGNDRRLSFNSGGRKPAFSRRVPGWQVDFGALNVQMNDLGRFIAAYHERGDALGRAAWRHTAEQIGMHLYGGLLSVDALLAQRLMALRREVRPPERLTLAFAGPRAYLSVPYELLHDGRAPLAVEHPLCRQVIGLPAASRSLPGTITALRQREDPLRILLIAADGPDSRAEEEIDAVYTALAERAPALDLPLEVDVLADGDLRLDAVRVRLTQCPYHLVHYAGRVHHDRADPDRGGLLFAQPSAPGYALLSLAELTSLLQHGQTALFFISAPIAPREWGAFVLRDQDYLDALVAPMRAGVASALGLRWHVADHSKHRLAASFYAALLREPFAAELALRHARRQIYDRDRQDEAWASPVLIAQPACEPEDEELS